MTTSDANGDLLATIVTATRRIVEVRQQQEPFALLSRRVSELPPLTGRFSTALQTEGRLNVIAECKRRSPSRGVLRADYDPVAIAAGYEAAGAAAISVLTEPTFFDGSLEHLRAVRSAVAVPVLRKDFIVDQYQLVEARLAGADAILLIVAALSRDQLSTLASTARSLGLDALVEVHTADELDIALAVGARIVGINNRDLRTLAVDVHASERLISRMPPGVTAVSESGLKTADDLTRLSKLGYGAFLIGERFMTQANPGLALALLLKAATEQVNAGSRAAQTRR